jgi:hypothetical protein
LKAIKYRKLPTINDGIQMSDGAIQGANQIILFSRSIAGFVAPKMGVTLD